ncbi:hypothetical protein M758_10G158300 [Ceratodon purpureus]|nr:hypothetical protein M758_10G158300 [Ceratodon purpureus]
MFLNKIPIKTGSHPSGCSCEVNLIQKTLRHDPAVVCHTLCQKNPCGRFLLFNLLHPAVPAKLAPNATDRESLPKTPSFAQFCRLVLTSFGEHDHAPPFTLLATHLFQAPPTPSHTIPHFFLPASSESLINSQT